MLGLERSSRWVRGRLWLALVFGGAPHAACATEIDSTPVFVRGVSKRSLLDVPGRPAGSFGDGQCHSCAEGECGSILAECHGDPGCAVYSACLLACPSDDFDALSADCVCRPSDNEVTERLAERLRSCFEGLACDLCTLDAGAPVAARPSDARPECAPRIANPDACNTCLWAECCDYQRACVDDVQCTSFRDCVVACPGSLADCVTSCEQSYPMGRTPLLQGSECAVTLCAAECGGRPDPCLDCVERECSALALECIDDAECWPVLECVTLNCSVAADYARCQDDCERSGSVAGVRDFRAWVECTVGRCPEECSE